MLTKLYPWQQSFWQSNTKLPSTLLLAGQAGIGKQDLALSLAYRAMCADDREAACGQCRHCVLNEAGTHPDFFILLPESPGKAIKIDEVRQLCAFTEKTPQLGSHKLVVMGPVENLTINAANAILKTLEESSDSTRIILFSHAISQVIATIRSRCHIINLPSPDEHQAFEWLMRQGSENEVKAILSLVPRSPLLALNLLEQGISANLKTMINDLRPEASNSVSEISNRWLAFDLPLVFEVWLQATQSMIKRSVLGQAPSHSLWGALSDWPNPSLVAIYEFLDLILLHKKGILEGVNLNKQLLLEKMLIQWRQCYLG